MWRFHTIQLNRLLAAIWVCAPQTCSRREVGFEHGRQPSTSCAILDSLCNLLTECIQGRFDAHVIIPSHRAHHRLGCIREHIPALAPSPFDHRPFIKITDINTQMFTRHGFYRRPRGFAAALHQLEYELDKPYHITPRPRVGHLLNCRVLAQSSRQNSRGELMSQRRLG